MVTSISRKQVTLTEDVVARMAASSLEEMARSLDIGGNLGLVSVISLFYAVYRIFFS